jgi:pimeloyl-ACP methyl ester carboxylesterase
MRGPKTTLAPVDVARAVVTIPLRAPRDLRGVGKELGAPAELLALTRSGILAGEGMQNGAGRPVLLLPGFLTSEGALQTMGRWLHRNGYRSYRFGRRPNVDCSEASLQRLERLVEQICADHDGDRVVLVGHSRGGHFARVLGVRRPDVVGAVITLGMPTLDPRSVSPVAGIPALATAALGTVGVPGFWSAKCWFGGCCADFRRELFEPIHASVRHVAIHSPDDGIVDFGAVGERHAERVAVSASHIGMIVNTEVYAAIAGVLADTAALRSVAA